MKVFNEKNVVMQAKSKNDNYTTFNISAIKSENMGSSPISQMSTNL